MNFKEGNQLQIALIQHLDPGHHNAARAEFMDLQGITVRRALLLLEKDLGKTPEVCEETVSRLRAILREQLGKDPQRLLEEIIQERAA